MEDGRDSGLILMLIDAGVRAGAFRVQARTTPEAHRGLLKMAAKYSARVGALAELMLAEAVGAAPRSHP